MSAAQRVRRGESKIRAMLRVLICVMRMVGSHQRVIGHVESEQGLC